MICDCDSVTLRRKKFSDFEVFNPFKEEANNFYIAGYIEMVDGEKKNVQIPSNLFIKDKTGDVILALDPDKEYDNFSVANGTYNGKEVKVVTINYLGDIDFLQLNTIDPGMFSEIDGKEYLCIKLSPKTPLGFTFRIYLPNFPFDKGIMLFPHSNYTINSDTPVEVFYNEQEGEEEQTANDFYITLIHLADPKAVDSEEVVLKTKVIRVLNIESDE